MKQLLRWLSISLAVALASPAWASLTVNNVQSALALTTTVTVTISVPAGHTVVCWTLGRGSGTTLGTLVDSSGNTYTAGALNTGFGTDIISTAWSIAIPSSITSVTYTPSGTGTVATLIVWDVTASGAITVASGGSNTNVYAFNSVTATDGTTTGSLTMTTTDGMQFAGTYNNSSAAMSAGTGYTLDASLNTSTILGEHKAVTASAAATFTSAGANDYIENAGVVLQVGGGSSCTHAGYTSAGATATPNATTGSYWLTNGTFGTPDCSTVNYWQPVVGPFGTN